MDLYNIILSLIVAVVTAVITARISIKGFYRQEIWLRKESQYSKIISSLSTIQKHYGDLFDYGVGIKQRSTEETNDSIQFKKLMNDIEIISLSPSYMIDSNVSEILCDLVDKSNEHTQDYVGHFNTMYGEIKQALIKISEYAKKDLKIK